jgi:DNA (cytosine-5)-methyltransferase 1
MSFTIGSLFDGSGGFPLAAFMCGGVPVWASEIEPYPIAVTKTRFPYMKHLGSVTDIKGNEVEPVDVITFGSPCQDLSVAGKRAGLKHTDNGDEETTRSGLFMEAVRIIKEMREATGGKFPRFALWENVPGAFSSNKGEDFRVVCEELIKIVEPTAVMPDVPKAGWPYADCYSGDGWSLSYRVLDAQHWGVAQRRRRVFLVLDLGGQCAREVSFERDGLRGYFAEGRTPWQGTAGDAEGGVGAADCKGVGVNGEVAATLDASYFKGCGMRQGIEREVVAVPTAYGWPLGFRPENTRVYEETATTLCNGTRPGFTCGVIQPVAYGISPYHSNCMKSSNPHSGIYEADTARTLDAMNCGYPACNQGGIAVVESAVAYSVQDRAGKPGGGKGMLVQENRATSLRTGNYQYIFQPVCMATQQGGAEIMEDKCPTITASAGMSGNNQPVVCYRDQHLFENHSQDSRYKGPLDVCPMLPAQLGTGGNNQPFVVESKVYESHPMDSRIKELGEVAPTVSVKWHKGPELYPTLQAKPNGGQSLNYSGAVRIQYIVRRLTPTECARLQGFPDEWAHPDKKDEFTDEEYEFWLNVRNNHAEINGKPVKSYTRDQMLGWYNKLHTDSAEYKLWGNGIALPCALYFMQGIADAMERDSDE